MTSKKTSGLFVFKVSVLSFKKCVFFRHFLWFYWLLCINCKLSSSVKKAPKNVFLKMKQSPKAFRDRVWWRSSTFTQILTGFLTSKLAYCSVGTSVEAHLNPLKPPIFPVCSLAPLACLGGSITSPLLSASWAPELEAGTSTK